MKRFSLLGWGTVQLIFFEVIIPNSLLGWSTVEFCLFRCNIAEFTVQMGNVEFSVQMGNGSVCWDVERISFVFFAVTTSSSLFRWETVQCFLLRNEVGMELSLSFCKVNRFSAFCYTTRLEWDSCVCEKAIV